MKIENGYVNQKLDLGILTIEFFHPQSNALPAILLKDLASSFETASQNDDVKLVVLQSAGAGAFCAGASFEELIAITNEAEGLSFFSGFANLINAMRNCTKFIIGRIHGKCAGGGVGLAAACDYAIAVKNASIKLSELAIGIGPFVVGPVVERKIGISAFSQLAIDANNWRTSEWALQKGLFAAVYPDDVEMDAAINSLSLTLQQSSPEAMAAIKKISWQGTEHWGTLLLERAAISGSLVLSSYTKAAIAAFKTKNNSK
ncbi:MAG: enoyl-CoA hydratase-related protein [Bacteroidota bacterium]